MIALDETDINDYVEHKTGKLHINLVCDIKPPDYGPFFNALNRNNKLVEFDVYGLYSNSGDYNIGKFMEKIRLPSNITKLGLPVFDNMNNKFVLPSHIEKLSLQSMTNITSIYFTENTKLKYIKFTHGYDVDEFENNIPKSVVKLYIGDYVYSTLLKLPPQIKFLKLNNPVYVNRIDFSHNSILEKIVITDIFTIPKEIIDLSHIYSLKIIKMRTIPTQKQCELLEKIKLPYGIAIDFY